MFLKIVIVCTVAICFLYTLMYAAINLCFRIFNNRFENISYENITSDTTSGESIT